MIYFEDLGTIIETRLRGAQFGFIPGRVMADAIFAVRNV